MPRFSIHTSFDVALSFAGADEDCARTVRGLLARKDVSVFSYNDEDMQQNIVGQSLPGLLQAVFSSATVIVIFASREYIAREYTRLELQYSIRGSTFLHLIIVDIDPDVPLEGVPAGVARASWHDGPEAIAAMVAKRVRHPDLAPSRKAPGDAVVHHISTVGRWLSEYNRVFKALAARKTPSLPDVVILAGIDGASSEDVADSKLAELIGAAKGWSPGRTIILLPGPHEQAAVARHSAALADAGVTVIQSLLQTFPFPAHNIVIHALSSTVQGVPSDDGKPDLDTALDALREGLALSRRTLLSPVQILVIYDGIEDDKPTALLARREFVAQLDELDVDIVLHGPGGQPTYTEAIKIGSQQEEEAHYRQGLYLMPAAEQLKTHLAFHEIRLIGTRTAHLDGAPSCVVRIAEVQGTRGVVDKLRFTVDRPTYAHLRQLQEAFGLSQRSPGELSRRAIRALAGPWVYLQAQVDGWNREKRWEIQFQERMRDFSSVLATDVLGPASWVNPRLLDYLAQQFESRRQTLIPGAAGTPFSAELLSAINKTGWRCEPPATALREDETKTVLEIARILIWSATDIDSDFGELILSTIDRYHKLFGVPVFYLDSDSVPAGLRDAEFIIGIGRRRNSSLGFRFRPGVDFDSPQVSVNDTFALRDKFHSLLENPRLQTLESAVGEIRGKRVDWD
jgi:hypothetical protein